MKQGTKSLSISLLMCGVIILLMFTIFESNLAELNSKVNKSGDTITGKLLSLTNSSGLTGSDLNYSFEAKYNNIQRTYIYRAFGIQEWYLNSSTVDAGWIKYTTPGNYPGIIFFNKSLGQRINIYQDGFDGLRLSASDTGLSNSKGMNIMTDGNLKVNNLSGIGNGYVCVGSTGILYRGNPTC